MPLSQDHRLHPLCCALYPCDLVIPQVGACISHSLAPILPTTPMAPLCSLHLWIGLYTWPQTFFCFSHNNNDNRYSTHSVPSPALSAVGLLSRWIITIIWWGRALSPNSIDVKSKAQRGARVAQSVTCVTLGVGSGPVSWVVRLSPVLGSALTVESAWDSPSLFPSPCSLTHSLLLLLLPLSKINNK